MSSIKLTDAVVKRTTLPPGKGDLVVWDSEVKGFGLRVRPASRSWIIAYRPKGAGRAGRWRMMKIGSTDLLGTATEARAKARAVLAKIAEGADPLADRRQLRSSSIVTLSAALDRYDVYLEGRSYVNRKVAVAGLRTKMRALLTSDVKSIGAADLLGIIDKLKVAGKPGAAEDFRKNARALFAWALSEVRIVDANPLAGIRKRRDTRADRISKETVGRALSDKELVTVWKAADPATSFGRMVRFVILTGCRRSEGARLTWSMVDRETRLITFPAGSVKQGRPHVVPISGLLNKLLNECTVDARSDLVFASSRTGQEMAGWTQVTARLVKASGVAFGLHDLRRTFRTGLGRLGIDSGTAEAALGHAKGPLEQIYNKDDAVPALRTAFDRWASHVEGLLVDDTIAAKEGIFA